MMKVNRTVASVLILLLILPVFTVSAQTSRVLGVKPGDWTEYELRGLMQTGSGLSNDEWVRMEFLNLAESNVTINATKFTSSWTEWNETQTIDLASENAQNDILLPQWYNARVYLIPAGLSVNDSVYLGVSFGNQTIMAQTSVSYAGAQRTVIEANFTDYEGNHYSLYWDKQTGVLTEAIEYIGGGYTDVLLSSTSLWNPDITWWIVLWILVAVAIILGIVTSKRKKSKNTQKKNQTQTSTNKT